MTWLSIQSKRAILLVLFAQKNIIATLVRLRSLWYEQSTSSVQNVID
jgi:hypothetical protein